MNDAPPPPERGSSYAVMSQQSALRSNGSTASNLPLVSQPASMKRVSFHDSNANSESMLRNIPTGTSNSLSMSMDTIREDPNVSYFSYLLCKLLFLSIIFVFIMSSYLFIIYAFYCNCFILYFILAKLYLNFSFLHYILYLYTLNSISVYYLCYSSCFFPR